MQIAFFFSGKIANTVKEKLLSIKHTYNPVYFASINLDTSTPEIDNFLEFMDITHNRVYFEQVRAPESIRNHKKSSKDVNVDNVYGMFYHNKKCFELIQQYQKKMNIRFDCIVKYRSDIDNEDDLVIPETLQSNTLYIPKGSDWFGGINDQIAYGDHSVMIKYSNLVDKIECYFDQGINLHPETLLAWHLKMNFINIYRIDFHYQIRR